MEFLKFIVHYWIFLFIVEIKQRHETKINWNKVNIFDLKCNQSVESENLISTNCSRHTQIY